MDLVQGSRAAPATVLAARRTSGPAAHERRGPVPVRTSAGRPDLDEVFRRDYRLVVGVAALVLASQDEAEDVAQEVFLSFSRSSVPAAEARGWLSVAPAHTALNHLRAGRRRTSRESSAAATKDAVATDVADVVVTLEERSRVRAAL